MTTYSYSLSLANTISMGPAISTWTHDTHPPILCLLASLPTFQCCHHLPLCCLSVIPLGSWTLMIASNHPTAFFGQCAPLPLASSPPTPILYVINLFLYVLMSQTSHRLAAASHNSHHPIHH